MQVLVAILKQEWPHNWPSFISDICEASKTNEVLCENNMQILKLLSEEVFDFSKDQMTTAKIKTMKESLNDVRIRQDLRAVRVHPRPKPEGLPPQRHSTDAAALPHVDPAGVHLREAADRLSVVIKPDANLAAMYEDATELEQVFIKKLALFFTVFMKSHLGMLETPETQPVLLAGMEYLVAISEVPDDEVFKICLEFYHHFSSDLYQASATRHSQDQVASFAGTDLRRGVYERLLTKIRLVVITRMAKPEEVLIVEDENAGEVVRETTKDTEAIAQYKSMRETLVYLTHLNNDDTEQIMLEKLSKQVEVSGSQFTWNSLNTLCWAIGSISGAMNEEEEKRFLVTVIKDLLNLVEMKRGKDNKAVVASNIMYVVGQYPRFLRAHWKFLRTVVNKLFEFMHELHPGVQDMACDTFLKISQKCKGKFMATQLGESIPFVEELLRQLHATVSDLETHQVRSVV
ncbi:unnamed protein product, partial [Ectocarpus sp. 8 AP-2014]